VLVVVLGIERFIYDWRGYLIKPATAGTAYNPSGEIQDEHDDENENDC
jgi:hypothetical protein